MSATTNNGNLLDGGTIDPFGAPTGKPLTLAEQAAMEEARRRRRIEETRNATTNINNRRGGYNDTRGAEVASDHAAEVARYGGQEAYDKHWTDIKKRNVAEAGKNFWGRAADTVAEHPWLPLLPLAPLAGAAFAPAAVGGGITAGSAAAPAITTGGAVTEATIAAPVATGAVTGGTTAATTAAAAVPAAEAAFTVGGALKEVAPVLGAVAPMAIDALAGGRTKEESALLHKQEQLAKEAKARIAQVQESRMNALGQQLLAMNPRNQMMAQMYGPGAAFQPQEFAAMTQNPMPPPEMPAELKALEGNTKPLTPEQKAAYAAFVQQKQQYEQGNQQRSDQMMNGMAPPGPGPAPLQHRTPQAARKY
jgi:hypothetical protein